MTHQEGTTCPHRKLNADVLMMQSAENCDRRTIRPNGQRHVKPASPCPKIGVYESDCGSQHKREADGEMALAKHQDMVKAFPSDRSDQPLTIAILPWGARRGRPIPYAHCPKSLRPAARQGMLTSVRSATL